MAQPSIIAIDGTAASGKSTVGQLLARSLGYLFFDTGVMYRSVAWAVIEHNIEVMNVQQVSELAEALNIEVVPDPLHQHTLVLVNGQDVTDCIRSPEVEAIVAQVSAYPRVRATLTVQQRRIAAGGAVVMVGRDIGTVVLPGADLKIFMQASAEERGRRRYEELVAQGKSPNFAQILAAIQERDKQDREKPISPMIPAGDAIIVETDHLSVAEVLAHVEQLVMTYPEGKKQFVR